MNNETSKTSAPAAASPLTAKRFPSDRQTRPCEEHRRHDL